MTSEKKFESRINTVSAAAISRLLQGCSDEIPPKIWNHLCTFDPKTSRAKRLGYSETYEMKLTGEGDVTTRSGQSEWRLFIQVFPGRPPHRHVHLCQIFGDNHDAEDRFTSNSKLHGFKQEAADIALERWERRGHLDWNAIMDDTEDGPAVANQGDDLGSGQSLDDSVVANATVAGPMPDDLCSGQSLDEISSDANNSRTYKEVEDSFM